MTTCSIGRQCFSRLFGEKKSTDETCPSLVRVPLVGVDAFELFGDLLQLLISSSCLNYYSHAFTSTQNYQTSYYLILMSQIIGSNSFQKLHIIYTENLIFFSISFQNFLNLSNILNFFQMIFSNLQHQHI